MAAKLSGVWVREEDIVFLAGYVKKRLGPASTTDRGANTMGKLMDKTKTTFWKLSMKGLPRGPHVTRYYLYQHLQMLGPSLPLKQGDVLTISDSDMLRKMMGIAPTSLVRADYPEYNLLALDLPDESFDFVISDMVIEHLEGDPQKAFDETLRVLRPGGIAIHTSAFIYRFHPAPGDFWRFSPDALRLLAGRFTTVLDCGGWGNFKATCLLRTSLRYVPLPQAKWHPLHRIAMDNDPEWPIVTWVVAQK